LVNYILLMGLLFVALIIKAPLAAAQSPSQPGCDQITVLGAVKTPVRFKVEHSIRLHEALTTAGGPNELAGKVVRLLHWCKCFPCAAAGVTSDIEYQLAAALQENAGANPYLVAGDMVLVPETEVVFARGNVLIQTSLVFREGVTLTRVIATVGIARNSDLVRIKIHHPGTASQKYAFEIVNLKAIKEGRETDPLLRPWDILEVSDEQGRFLSNAPSRFDQPFRDTPIFPRISPNC
jgi:hypothetical protein